MKTQAVGVAVFLGLGILVSGLFSRSEIKKDSPEKMIIQIYDEVKEMGSREGEDFIKREFHFDLDGRKKNREEHILVLSYFAKNQHIFSIQVTYYEDENSENYQGRAKSTKDINCLITDGTAEIKECSYTQEEANALLTQILLRIKREKELLKFIRTSKESVSSIPESVYEQTASEFGLKPG